MRSSFKHLFLFCEKTVPSTFYSINAILRAGINNHASECIPILNFNFESCSQLKCIYCNSIIHYYVQQSWKYSRAHLNVSYQVMQFCSNPTTKALARSPKSRSRSRSRSSFEKRSAISIAIVE